MTGSDEEHASDKNSVRDEAALLLSIADIAKSELRFVDMADLWKDPERDGLLPPKFPTLSSSNVSPKRLPQHRTALVDLISSPPDTDLYPSNRVRAVSIDALNEDARARTPSPVSPLTATPLVTPIQTPRLTLRKPRRASTRAKQTFHEEIEISSPRAVSFANQKNRPLQGACPIGTAIKKISRRKFSWKNYPEVS